MIAVDLRNELRGSRQNKKDWYTYVRKGARTIHEANPNVLIVISGLNFDSDFTFLKKKSLGLEDLKKKIVYEVHLYSFTGSSDRWTIQPLNRLCGDIIESQLGGQSTFLMKGDDAAPMIMSEVGYDMTGGSQADKNFMTCFVAFAAMTDLDWNLWAFGGTYYERQGQLNFNESFGVLDSNWKDYKDKKFSSKFQLLQRKVQGIYLHTHK